MILNRIKIGKKLFVAPFLAIIFLVILAVFSDNALKSERKSLNNIVEVKFALYKASSKLLSNINLYNSVLYKVFSYVNSGYEQNQIDEQLKILFGIGTNIDKEIKILFSQKSLDKETKVLLANIGKNKKEYMLSVKDAIDMLSIDVGMATPMLSVTDEFFLSINKNLLKINKIANDENQISYDNALNKIDNTLFTLNILIITTVILSLLITWSVGNSIKVPLNKFQKGLLDFFKYMNKETSEAKLIDIGTKDELSDMAESINANILKIKKGIEEDKLIVSSAISCANEAKRGFLNTRIEGKTTNPSLNELKDVINQMLEEIEKNIKIAMNVLSKYSKYDYKEKIDYSKMDGHLKELCIDINSLGKAITTMLNENKNVGELLSSNSKNLSSNVSSLTNAANSQAAVLEETAAAIEEITSNMKSSYENIKQMTNNANDVSQNVTHGQKLATETALSMDKINEQTQAIAEAITVIDQIAFQTNILSLNAAVEAATAGEAGKGFAVVAQEVRNLAARSAEAAKEIESLVENATLKANDGKSISNDMIEGYHNLNSNIKNTLDLIKDVSDSSKEQFSAMEQINDTVNNLDKVTQQNAQSAEEANKVAKEVNSIAIKVVDQAKEFENK